MIQPFHFGSGTQRLFGAYHQPIGDVRLPAGVVLCYPAAHEYIWAHRAFRQLAEQLAAAGLHVLRFDYFATGDSAGEAYEGSLSTWTENIAVAIDELKEMTGLTTVSLAGLRIGATLAARAAHTRNDIDRLVLWDPIVSGSTYFDEVVSLHRLLNVTSTSLPLASDGASASRQLLGFPVTDRLEIEMKALRLQPGDPRAKRVLVVVSEERPEYALLRLAPKDTVGEWTFSHVPGSGRWDQIERVGTALLPRDIIVATTAWLAAA